jgi:hypothetical protein
MWATSPVKEISMKSNKQFAEELLDTKITERPKEHVLKTPKKPSVKEKNKAATQRKAIQHDLGE